MQKFEVPLKLPGLNELINANRASKYKGKTLKDNTDRDIVICIKAAKIKHINKPVFIKFVWFEQTKRRDKDNVASAKKFVLDALQKARVLEDDNNKWIMGFEDHFVYGKGQKVLVEIYECDEVKGAED